MADEAVRTSVIGKLLWQARRMLVVLTLLGAGLGAFTWLVLPQTFTSTTKVLLQGASDESEVPTAAEIAMGRVVVQRALADLGWEASSVDKDAVSAEATQGSVVTISATADSPARARALAAAVTAEYITFAAEVAEQAADAVAGALDGRREDLQRQITALDAEIDADAAAALVTSADQPGRELLATRREDLLQALHDLEQQIADARAEAAVGTATLQVIEPAEIPETSSTPTLPLLALAGAATVAGAGIAVLAARRLADRRPRRRTDIATALGAPVLGTVAAPHEPDPAGSRRSVLRWLTGTDTSGNGSQSQEEHGLERLRYSRLLDRLYRVADGPIRIAVVTADNDSHAALAVVRLVQAADAKGHDIAVVSTAASSQHDTFSAALADRTIEEPTDPSATAPDDHYPPGGLLRVITVPPARPTVPRVPGVSGVLIVTTSGTRTTWELLAIAEACRDAVMPVLGALVVVPVGDEEDVEAGSRMAPSEPATLMAGRLNGHLNGSKA